MAKTQSALRCVATLAIIAVVCGALLSTLNGLLAVPASAEDIGNAFNKSGYSWTVVDTVEGDYGKGGKVTLVAKGISDGEDSFIGLLVRTDKSGKLNESLYAVYFNLSTDVLEYAKTVEVGSTGGFDWEYAKAHAGGGTDVTTGATPLTELLSEKTESGNGAWRDYEDFYVKIDGREVFADYDLPAKTGATRTVTATFDAFRLAAAYYYDNFVAKNTEGVQD